MRELFAFLSALLFIVAALLFADQLQRNKELSAEYQLASFNGGSFGYRAEHVQELKEESRDRGWMLLFCIGFGITFAGIAIAIGRANKSAPAPQVAPRSFSSWIVASVLLMSLGFFLLRDRAEKTVEHITQQSPAAAAAPEAEPDPAPTPSTPAELAAINAQNNTRLNAMKAAQPASDEDLHHYASLTFAARTVQHHVTEYDGRISHFDTELESATGAARANEARQRALYLDKLIAAKQQLQEQIETWSNAHKGQTIAELAGALQSDVKAIQPAVDAQMNAYRQRHQMNWNDQ